MLDSLVRTTSLSALDRNDTRASRFAARTVPAITSGVEYPDGSPSVTTNGGGASLWDAVPTTQSPTQHASPLHTHQPGALGGAGGGVGGLVEVDGRER